MSLLALAALLSLIALDLLRDRLPDPRPVLTHPRSLLLFPAFAAVAAAAVQQYAAFLLCCAASGAVAAMVSERIRLTERGVECRGAVLEWRTLAEVRRTPLFLELRTTRGQRLLLPRWMDGLGTLTRAAEQSTLWAWSRPAGSSS